MATPTATSAVTQAFSAAWDTMWPNIAQTLPLLHFTTGGDDEWRTALDPLVLQNPTTGAMKFGTEFGDTCRCHGWGPFKSCGPGLFRVGLTSVDKLRTLVLDAPKLTVRLACGAAATQKALVFAVPFAGTATAHIALEGRFSTFIPFEPCKNIKITKAEDVRVSGVAQFIVPLAPGPNITVGPVTYTGTGFMLSGSTVAVGQLSFDLDAINSIVDYLTNMYIPVPEVPQILQKMFRRDVNKELNSFLDPTFRKAIPTQLSPSLDVTVPIPFAWVCADTATLPPGAAAVMDLQVLGPAQWPCVPSTVDQTPGSGGSSLFVNQTACGSDEICAVCGNAFGSACPTLPGACVKADCDPLCNTSATGQCCGSQQVCLNKGPQGSCCTPVCAPCEAGSDGCGGSCVPSCTDPAQHCGSGSTAGQCVNNINVTNFPANANAQGEVVLRAVVHRKHGPLFAQFNTPGQQYAGSITLTPLVQPPSGGGGGPPLTGSNLVLPTYFVFMAATAPWATPYVVLPDNTGGLAPYALCANTAAQNGNPMINGGGSSDNPIMMPVGLVPANSPPGPPYVQFNVRPIVPPGQTEYCYLGAAIPGDPNAYTLSYIGVAGFVMLVAGPAATAGVRTDPAEGFVSTLWQLGACNSNTDCISGSTASGFGTCLGNVCFPGSGNTSGSSFGSSFGSSVGSSAGSGLQGPRAQPSRYGGRRAQSGATPLTVPPQHASLSTPAIVGIAIGGAVVLLIIVLVAVLVTQNKRRRRYITKK
jgi:hypothetical protein